MSEIQFRGTHHTGSIFTYDSAEEAQADERRRMSMLLDREVCRVVLPQPELDKYWKRIKLEGGDLLYRQQMHSDN